jgi:hypothetical protein
MSRDTDLLGALLLNAETARFHPVVFRRAPLPGNGDAGMTAQRYRVDSHHAEGFATSQQARGFLERNGIPDTGATFEWDGREVPAMTEWFSQGPSGLRREGEGG